MLALARRLELRELFWRDCLAVAGFTIESLVLVD